MQKILSRCGVASRRGAEALIEARRVTVNGEICRLGDTADLDRDQIRVDGTPVAPPAEKVYIMLNKPRGYVTTASDEKGRRTVLELVDCGTRVYPVGRLDMDSEGLLLLTNDGDFANRLLHPSHEVEKTYRVWLAEADSRRIQSMGEPMMLDGRRTAPARVKCLWLRDRQASVLITIHEGRNRQIRRMAQMCGMRVTRLQRVAEGGLRLDGLKKGRWRYLTEEERRALLRE